MSDTDLEDRLQRSFHPEDWAALALDTADAKEALVTLEVVARLLARAQRRLDQEAPSTARELVRAAVAEVHEAYSNLVRSPELSDQIAREATKRVGFHMTEVNQILGQETQGTEGA